VPATELIRLRDTCNVWVLRRGREAVCVDFGSGLVLDQLDALGIDRVADVLVTHHHRDCVQGLGRAAAAGARIWVPPVERRLFTDVDEFWAARRLENDYDLLDDRFSLVEPVEIAGVVSEYRTQTYGGIDVYTLPTPGHTPGSVTYLVELEGRTLAFTGDLLAAAGQVWSLAATQWSYGEVEGQAATILSLGVVARRAPGVLLPAHGEPIEAPAAAIAETQARLQELMELRRGAEEPWDLQRWLDDPWVPLSPHLLRSRTSFATSYALLSDDGAALVLDWGYDLWTGLSGGPEWTCRPLLHSIDALGVPVETVVTTHFHDDHVAGLNLLRDVHGTAVWSPENVAPILEDPAKYDLPCLWFAPIRVDRVLPFGEPIAWHEHELVVHPLPGHTRYAAAIELVVDGRRVLATGDQQSHESSGRSILNYQYRNRFSIEDYVRSAELYARVRPDVLLTGHWGARDLTEELLARLAVDGARLAELHRELLPFGDAEGRLARCTPYRVTSSTQFDLAVEVANPFDTAQRAIVQLVMPEGWRAEPAVAEVEVAARGRGAATFRVSPAPATRRVAIAADVTIGDTPFGQQAEAVVTVA
jgi:glyoxylase-like metal-dependent hydrolase (beta-lactamase superfamily II)